MKLGIVGWRGMVGSVLLDRMIEEGDFSLVKPSFFSTSQAGQTGPNIDGVSYTLLDARNIQSLGEMDAIISCQGGSYTKEVYDNLRDSGWSGYWIDAASSLRMREDCCIVLDPVNSEQINAALAKGVKTFAGGNCTVSLMLMALAPLFRAGLVEWLSSMTYQAASGAGAAQMKELFLQNRFLDTECGEEDVVDALSLEREIRDACSKEAFPTDALSTALAYNVLPYIDSEMEDGQSREEWKGEVESNKILGLDPQIPIDGVCVRVPVLRCHSQAFTLKLKSNVSLEEIERMLSDSHQWLDLVPNNKEDSLARLTPSAVTGSLTVALGRLRKLSLGEEYLGGFTVGDQLLWGAAEPLRRMARILLAN